MKNDHGWLEFMQGQMLFSLVCGILFGLVLLGAELLHFVSSGKTPSLIERLVEWQPSPRYEIKLDDDDEGEEGEIDGDDIGGTKGGLIQYWNP